MKWSIIEIDHVKPFCMFDVTKDEELREAFNWKNTQPLLKHDHKQKGVIFNLYIINFNLLRHLNLSN